VPSSLRHGFDLSSGSSAAEGSWADFVAPQSDDLKECARGRLLSRDAFRAHGGLVTSDELASSLIGHCLQPLSQVARWIVSRAVVMFEFGGRLFIPLFQFDESRLAVRAEVTGVLVELRDVFDDWELALWFVEPNFSLGDATPLERLSIDATEVLGVARLDHFLARG
jgi:hypothetical protein